MTTDTSPRNKPVLVVDDTANMRTMMRMMLSRCGFENIREFANANDALAHIEQEVPFLIISDHNMPGISGSDFLASVRVKYPELPFVMLTVDSNKETVVKCIQYNVTSFLKKPIDTLTLEETLNTILKAQQSEESNSSSKAD